MTLALYPGSFDPFTNGHLDVVKRAAGVFGELIVAVAANPEKRTPLFTPDERVEMIREAVGQVPAVEVTTYRGLTVHYAQSRGVRTLVKGLRVGPDFDAELQQALMNRELAPAIETVFLVSAVGQIYVSSSLLKDVGSHGGDVSQFVPPAVARRMAERFR